MNPTIAAPCPAPPSTQRHDTHIGVCRGSLGELFQGPSVHCANEIVIISALIQHSSTVWLIPPATHTPIELAGRTRCDSSSHPKAFKALDLYCTASGLAWPEGDWLYATKLEVGRGMASSTADIVAMLRCAASYHQQPIADADLMRILSAIERSDSVFLDQLALFCSSKHQIIQLFSPLPRLYAAYFHEPDPVETDSAKAILLAHYQHYLSHYQPLYQRMLHAFSTGNTQGICQVSTHSSQLGQHVLPKPHFVPLQRRMQQFKANGIITAHTGSVLGYLFCDRPDSALLASLSIFFADLGGQCRLVEIGS